MGCRSSSGAKVESVGAVRGGSALGIVLGGLGFAYSLRCSSFLGFNQFYIKDPKKVAAKRSHNGDYREGFWSAIYLKSCSGDLVLSKEPL